MFSSFRTSRDDDESVNAEVTVVANVFLSGRAQLIVPPVGRTMEYRSTDTARERYISCNRIPENECVGVDDETGEIVGAIGSASDWNVVLCVARNGAQGRMRNFPRAC